MDFWSLAQPFIGAALGSGFAVTGLKLWYDHKKDEGKREERVKFLATQIVFLLEGYAVDLADRLADHDFADEMKGQLGTKMSSLPPFAEIPKSDDYPLLDRKLLERLYALPQELQLANRAVSFIFQIGGPEGSHDKAKTEGFRIAHRVLELADAFRAQYSMDRRNLFRKDWDMREFVRAGAEVAHLRDEAMREKFENPRSGVNTD